MTKRTKTDALENPPHPSALIQSMRSIGYMAPTALADLVDNSITAGARTIRIRISPPQPAATGGYVVVEDDGTGMTPECLVEALRWGGEGPDKLRLPGDLGRFGLGLKTASLSMGSRLTVASRSAGKPLHTLRWDLDHVAKVGWRMLEGPDADARELLTHSALATEKKATGTMVIVTGLDRLAINARQTADQERNAAALTRKVAQHLGMVFHRFIASGVVIRLGASLIPAWDPFERADLKDEETLGDGVKVSSYVLPHHSRVTPEDYERMAGPSGWEAHQGFLVYRAKRLIMPGGWFRLFAPSDSCRLARIRVDLPNALDAGWKLSVMKSSVEPPSWQTADLERIGEATRRLSKEAFNFRGERQAPTIRGEPVVQSFWRQVPTPEAVRFHINRAHPVVQTLKQSVRDPRIAEEFLRAFERMLPLDAILQDPKRTTNGAVQTLDAEQLEGLVEFARKVVKTLQAQGLDASTALEVVLSAEPFVTHIDKIRPRLE